MGNRGLSFSEMEASLQTHRLSSFLSGSLISTLRRGAWTERDVKLGDSCLGHGHIFRVPSDCRSCHVGATPVFREPQGKQLWVQS